MADLPPEQIYDQGYKAGYAIARTIDDDVIERAAEAIFIARNGERNRRKFNQQREPYIADAKAAIRELFGDPLCP